MSVPADIVVPCRTFKKLPGAYVSGVTSTQLSSVSVLRMRGEINVFKIEPGAGARAANHAVRFDIFAVTFGMWRQQL